MGINSTEVAYGFGQMGSVISTTTATLTPPTGKVFVAITMLADTVFNATNGLVADNDSTAGLEYIGTDEAAHDAYFGTGTQIAANGGDGAAGAFNQALSVVVAATVSFPKGLTIYGRWTNISLQGSNYTHGIIVYYGE